VLENSEMTMTQTPPRTESLHQHAERELRTIRRAMQRAGSFTALPGWGGMAMGVVGVASALLAARAGSASEWLEIWLIAAALAVPVGSWTLWQEARRAGVDLTRGPARLFVFSLAPPLLVGAVLSAALWTRGSIGLLPATWLLLYGMATLASGTFSLRLVAAMGACFIALGSVAAFAPLAMGNLLLGVGFGGLHVVFGFLILRRQDD
jgi:hypothetical protein